MGEADWWLCSNCSSLNNLAARKCYSCRQRKPKEAVRASEALGYVPVVSWDGKVSLHSAPKPEWEPAAEPGAAPMPMLRPIRDPMPRDILAVAPRPPHPARMTYRLDEPPPARPVAPGMTRLPPAPGIAPPGPPPSDAPVGRGTPPPGAVDAGAPWPPRLPASPGPGPAGSAGPGPGHVVPPGPHSQQVVAMGPGPVPAEESAAERWPHWRELLDGPTPHAERLRSSLGHGEVRSRAPGSASAAAGRTAGTLSEAIRQARVSDSTSSRVFIPWPEADRPGREVGDERRERARSSPHPSDAADWPEERGPSVETEASGSP